MRIKPLSEEEAAAQSADLWPNGTYDYEVREATEKESASGNEMVELEVWIYDQAGGRRLVFDYLVSTEKAAWKIRHFAASCGLLEQYNSGNLMANEMVGRTGKCQVGTQPAKDQYPAKNIIREYTKAEQKNPAQAHRPAMARSKVPAGDIDDEIPF